MLVTQLCPTLCDPMDCSPSGSSVHGFSRQEYWSGLQCPSPGTLPDPGVEPGFPASQADSLLSEQSQICRWHHPYGRKWRTKEPLDERWKRRVKKVGLKLNIQKAKIMASGPITLWQINGNQCKYDWLYFGGLQSHWRWWLQPWN